jgi:hypothetical protein
MFLDIGEGMLKASLLEVLEEGIRRICIYTVVYSGLLLGLYS